MVSKNWQRTQTVILHLALAVCVAYTFFLFELSYPSSLKVTAIVLGYLILIPFFRWLHKRFAKTFVKVFRCDFENAARIVQRALNAERLPFTKQNGGDQIVFILRTGGMKIVVDDFMLNLPIDHHLTPEVATKVTLLPETLENAEQMARLRQSLDAAFAVQGW